MLLVGKSSGKPKYGCPFCSASVPYLEDGQLYTLGDLLHLHQVLSFNELLAYTEINYRALWMKGHPLNFKVISKMWSTLL